MLVPSFLEGGTWSDDVPETAALTTQHEPRGLDARFSFVIAVCVCVCVLEYTVEKELT